MKVKIAFAIFAVTILLGSACIVLVHNDNSPDSNVPSPPKIPDDSKENDSLALKMLHDDTEAIILKEIKEGLENEGYYISLGYLRSSGDYGLLAIPFDADVFSSNYVLSSSSNSNLVEKENASTKKEITSISNYIESSFIGFNAIEPKYTLKDIIIEDFYAPNSTLAPIYTFDISDIDGQIVNNDSLIKYHVHNSVISYSIEQIPFDRYADDEQFEKYVEDNADKSSYLYDYDIRSQIFGDVNFSYSLESTFDDLDYDQLLEEINKKIINQKEQSSIILYDIPLFCSSALNAYFSSLIGSSYMGIILKDLEEEFNSIAENEYLVIEDGKLVPKLLLDPPIVPSDSYKKMIAISAAIIFVVTSAVTFGIGTIPSLIIGGAIVGASIDIAAQVVLSNHFLSNLDTIELFVSIIASSISFALPGLISEPYALLCDALISGITDSTLTLINTGDLSQTFDAFTTGIVIGCLFDFLGDYLHLAKKYADFSKKINDNWGIIATDFLTPATNKIDKIMLHYNVKKIEEKIAKTNAKQMNQLKQLEIDGYNIRIVTELLDEKQLAKYPDLKDGVTNICIDDFPVTDFSSYAPSLNNVKAMGEIRFINVGSRYNTTNIVSTGVLEKDLMLLRMANGKDLVGSWLASNYDQAYTDMAFNLGITKKDLIDLKHISGKSLDKRVKVIEKVISHSPGMNKEELLIFTKDKLILHEQFIIKDDRLVAVGVLVPESIHKYSHLGANAYTKYVSSQMEMVESAFSPNGEYITVWESKNISGTSDGIIKIENIRYKDGEYAEKIYYADGHTVGDLLKSYS